MAQIEVRLARNTDREAVLAFCAQTWEWGDYIDRDWDHWLNNLQGALFVVTVDGQPTGIVHLAMLSELDAWIEGLRVDPNYRQQGLATALAEAALAEAMRRNATHVRLVTASENEAARRIFENFHMRQVGGFALFRAQPLPAPSKSNYEGEQTRLATADDLDEIIDYLNASNVFPLTGGLYYVDFTAYVITAETLARQIERQQISLLKRWERLDGIAIAEPRQDFRGHYLSIGYIDGLTVESISLIAYDLRRRITTLSLESLFVYAPDIILVRDGLTGIEYTSNNNIFYTYERSLLS